MSQRGDVGKPHHARCALDGVDEAEGFVQLIHAVWLSLQNKESFHQTVNLLIGLVDESRDVFRHLSETRITGILGFIGHVLALPSSVVGFRYRNVDSRSSGSSMA